MKTKNEQEKSHYGITIVVALAAATIGFFFSVYKFMDGKDGTLFLPKELYEWNIGTPFLIAAIFFGIAFVVSRILVSGMTIKMKIINILGLIIASGFSWWSYIDLNLFNGTGLPFFPFLHPAKGSDFEEYGISFLVFIVFYLLIIIPGLYFTSRDFRVNKKNQTFPKRD